MSKINVMITGVGGGGVGEQILKCLKMSSLDLNIIGCDMNRNSMGLLNVDKAYLVPSASSDNYIDTILDICSGNGVQVLFHGSEPELKILSKNRRYFEDKGVFIPLNSQDLIDICMDKYRTMEFLQSHGFATQKYWNICNIEDLNKIDIFPVVLKPSIGGGGSINTFIVQDQDELYMFGRYLLKVYKQFLAQEYVGNAYSEYTVGVLHANNGKYINTIAVKKNILSGLSNKTKVKNRTNRVELGEYLVISSGISQGEIGKFSEVTEPCKDIASKLKSTASINIQCRIHEEKMYVFEINPRISGTSSLRAMVGYNEPELIIRDRILGENIECDFKYRSGYIARGLSEEYLSPEFMDKLGGVDSYEKTVISNV